MRRKIAGFLAGVLLCLSLTACSGREAPVETLPQSSQVSLKVVTSFGGDDGNRRNYEAALEAYELASGNVVLDYSESSSEDWKAKVMQDFETGNEPDVLFYFTGADADAIISAGLVVPIDEIRQEYPEYATNMREELLAPSSVDGKAYSVPVSSYAEALFVNKRVLRQAGVSMPGADYTWEQFLSDCEKVKEAGLVPIAASLQEVPHYLFEYTVFNESGPDSHLTVPKSPSDRAGACWEQSLSTIADLYDRGYFPESTLTAGAAEAVQLLAEGQAAFLIDGTWQLGFFRDTCGDSLDDIGICYVPGTEQRAATDMIGGISMGYYMTKKAWDNPKKRDAAIRFIGYMTSDSVASTFAASPGSTPLKDGGTVVEDMDSLQQQAVEIIENATSFTPAVQDLLTTEARRELLTNIKAIVTDRASPQEILTACLAIQNS